ncbi:MAG TPA: hypothetical protein VFZ81_01365 [Burkholderiales bacterium]
MIKLGTGIVGALVLAWLALWVADTGLLVYSADTGVVRTRDCRYLVGVTVVRKYAPLAQRCSLLSKGSAPVL